MTKPRKVSFLHHTEHLNCWAMQEQTSV